MSRIEVKQVTKEFGKVTALQDVSLQFEENKICGLLGRNGAGKTTLLNLITNKLFPTAGEVFVDGESVRENDAQLSKIYLMSEKNLYPDRMRVMDALKWSKEFYPQMDMEYASQLAGKFSLNRRKRIKELSTGYVSVFKIIIALSSNAPVLLFDEPVLGLDANFRDLFYKELILNYSMQPKTIVISTHLIEEAAEVIENVVILKAGRMILSDTVQNVLEQGYTVTGAESLVDRFIQGKNVLGSDRLGSIKSAYLMEKLDQDAIPEGLELSRLKLQSLFIHLTNI